MYTSKLTKYGLHPTIWRKIRLHHSGLIEIGLYNKEGLYLGIGIISRYESCITITSNINFKDICFKTLIKDAKGKYISKHIHGNKIAIGKNYM